ncbi:MULTISPECIES: exodeoxyribonuclease VII small subunit [Carnobacterium]|uniref:Exodeoxyribonuclease 7 small subunit n=1 Tax=Carnobacterium divergens TaxID=2748 RepID=A0A2R8A1K1_CARDV|nr:MULTISPECIES: exodeoxyribonuclease VII small subunit [Carnobacterium]MCO6017308.1 exodeoxyribonuclease VII small subunit [Carnobacterium divergens]MDT1939277.1 exodeoxyribonuclease VII small subunit [Carnobacterium divergens]MDT1941715.1 exodeoxyribonuclease VII small subunit [Carnobacterium divergens]MDT1947513.1 exodeoxyribonuclease VII small subunit [Carnobacterium divergens]MDT1949952.1 exodeoxyribonuclease VII small subunit [Carnobacterium divergens]
MTVKKQIKFEEAMQQLEEIVTNLEQGDVPLEEALEQFQKGVGLSKICKETLQNAEKTLTKMVDENGEETLFETDSE